MSLANPLQPSPNNPSSLQRQDALLRATLSAMRGQRRRYGPFVLKLAQAELYRRQLQLRDAADQQPATGRPTGCHSFDSTSNSNNAAATAYAACDDSGLFTKEERVSLVGWSAIVTLVVIAFFVWTPPKRADRFPFYRPPHLAVLERIDAAELDVDLLQQRPLPEIVALADHDDPRVRARMIAVLVRLEAVDALVTLRHHRHLGVRAAIPAAVASLGRAGHARIPDLVDGLYASDPLVRESTAQALRQLVGEYGAYRGQQSDRERTEIARQR